MNLDCIIRHETNERRRSKRTKTKKSGTRNQWKVRMNRREESGKTMILLKKRKIAVTFRIK